ncbi:hypothetical protein HYV82_02295 [Candidatus Woesearchaeota archaeon]|nr:hypothetical protein [Candidatus Woesearchaeota archaeon]
MAKKGAFCLGETYNSNNHNNSKSKRTFHIIRTAILNSLSGSQQTINQIAVKTGINWRTVELHLTYLAGRGLVREIFSSQYVRIFALTEHGREALKNEIEKLMEKLIIKNPEGRPARDIEEERKTT